MKKFGILMLAALSIATLDGCHRKKKKTEVVYTEVVYYDTYAAGWYDVYGYYCGGSPRPGCNYWSDGSKIVDVEDPYFYDYYYWDYYYDYWYGEWVYESPNGIIYDEWGHALNSADGSVSLDLVGDVAAAQEEVIKGAASKFAARYNLDADVALRTARAMNEWANLGKTRARTNGDMAKFSERIYGVKFDRVLGALDQWDSGNIAEGKEVIEDIASYWKTSPENMTQILKNFYKGNIEEESAENNN